ncbi:MAG: phosphohydrolase [Candidatus Nitrosocaldaceae archaeon]|nr:MAG: phosphohydrolase [Candidatus Nitrosocaldaceae archaeon]
MQLEISDPIHHYIYLNDLEKDIVDTSIFQRLRRIRQLAGAHLTYPSAHHTRFEHSLGAKHLASLASNVLYEKGYINKDDIQRLRLAALLHDIGHGPFSHLFEEVIKQDISHEAIGSNIIKDTILNDILSKHGYSSDDIADLSRGRSKIKFLNEIISGILSVDVMDYLPRDSYFTGAEHARIDSERLIRSYEVYEDRLALDRSALYSLESMMISRYQMFKAVYFHKTVRAAEVMLLHSMLEAYKELNLDMKVRDVDEYLALTDDTMLNLLLNANKRSAKLARDYLNRRLLKCVFEKIIHSREKKSYSIDIKKEIADRANIDEDNIYIDISNAPSLSLTPDKDKPTSIILVKKDLKSYEVISLEDLPLINSILGYMNMIRVYTLAEYRDEVRDAANKVFNDKMYLSA